MSVSQKREQFNNGLNYKIIVNVTGALLLTLACLSFALSFNSLTELSKMHGVSIPQFIPLLLEGGMIVFSLSALVQNIQGQAAYWQWFLIIAASVTAMVFNVIHAQAGDIVGQVLHAIPSIILLVGFESFLSQLKSHVKQANVTRTYDQLSQEVHRLKNELSELDKSVIDKAQYLETIRSELSEMSQEKDKIQAQIKKQKTALESNSSPNDTDDLNKANDTRQAQIDERRNQVLKFLNDTDMSQSDIATELGVSLATIKRDTKALNGKVHNG